MIAVKTGNGELVAVLGFSGQRAFVLKGDWAGQLWLFLSDRNWPWAAVL